MPDAYVSVALKKCCCNILYHVTQECLFFLSKKYIKSIFSSKQNCSYSPKKIDLENRPQSVCAMKKKMLEHFVLYRFF